MDSPSNQGHRVSPLAPTRIAADLDAFGLHTASQLSKVSGDRTLSHWSGDEHPAETLAIRIRQPRQNRGLQSIQECLDYSEPSIHTPDGVWRWARLTQARNTGEDVNIPINNSNGRPEFVLGEDNLLAQVSRCVCRELDHAHFGPQVRRVDVPSEVWLGWMWFRNPLHTFEGLLMKNERQAKRLRNRLVSDIVVSVLRVN